MGLISSTNYYEESSTKSQSAFLGVEKVIPSWLGLAGLPVEGSVQPASPNCAK